MQKIRNEVRDLKQFGIFVAAIFTIFGTVHFIKHSTLQSQLFFGIGIMIFCVSVLIPKTLKPIYAIFLKTTRAIGWFNTKVILILIYFIFVSPIGIIIKAFVKDPLDRKIDKNALSYWTKRATLKTTKEQLEKQF